MNEDQIKLLKRALDTYTFFIEQNMNDKFDVNDSNNFFLMKKDTLNHHQYTIEQGDGYGDELRLLSYRSCSWVFPA